MSRKSQRTNLILLVIVGLLGAGAAVKKFFVKSSYETGETAVASEALFGDFKKDQVTAVVIDGPDDKKVELAKDGDHWNLVNDGNFRADKADVDRVLSGIEKLKRGKVASNRTDKLDVFNLQKGKGIEVTAYGAGGKSSAPVAAFTIGKSGDDWKFAFVRLSGDKDAPVRKVEGSTSDFEAGYDNTWRDKTIFDNGDVAKIEEITITGAKGPVTLVRHKEIGPQDGGKPAEGSDAAATTGDTPEPQGDKPATQKKPDQPAKPDQEVKETSWQITAPTAGRAKKWLGDNIATHLAKLECASFFTGTEKASELGLDPPAFVASVKREGEKEAVPVLFVGNKGKDGKYPVKTPKDATIWWIDSWKGDYLTKSADELIDAPPKTDEKKPDAESDLKKSIGFPDEPKSGDEKPADPKAPDPDDKKGEPAKPDATPPANPPDGGSAKPPEPKPDGNKPDGNKPDGGGL